MSFRLFVKQFFFWNKKQHRFCFLNKSYKDNGIINVSEKSKVLYIEISVEKINTLLAQRIICAADVRCLDANSKYCLRELCLATCLYKKQSYQPGSQLLGNLTDSPLQIKNDD